jgi:branched-chain amino acid transport system ATP-binding protein
MLHAPVSSQRAVQPVLDVQHLSMRFGGLTAVDDLSFSAAPGEITAIIGPNGAGKTTVFNCITGFYKPTAGMLRLIHPEGQEFLLERMDDHEINRTAKVARTFQNIRLFSGMTVLENLLVAQHNRLSDAAFLSLAGLRGLPGFSLAIARLIGLPVAGILGLPGYRRAHAEAMDLACHWLERIGLIDRADDAAGELPYGGQRRLEIARAMCTSPVLLCLDEPAAGLNPRESAELNSLLAGIRDELGLAILLIEHDMGVVMGISDHIVVLDYGSMISSGPPDFVRNDPRVIAAYLGVADEDVEIVEAEINL